MNRHPFFSSRKVVFWLSCLCCLLWGSAYPAIKNGYALLDFDFSLLGEGFVVIAAFILSAASIYGKRVSQSMDSIVLTGYQLGIGGVALMAGGYLTGCSLTGFTPASTALLIYLALLSSVSFALWTILLKYNRVGMVTIFSFLIPIFGAILSAIFLGESILEWKNVLALGLVCVGIWLVSRESP